MPDAMPLLHRWFGNPLLTKLAKLGFRVPVHDVYCRLRGFSKDLFDRLDLRCGGMEFAVEMVVKASLFGARIAEVPVTLHRDGRKAHGPHLRSFRDGWRTLRFFLMYTPRWLFLVPGASLIVLGAIGYGIALPGLEISGVTFDAHTLLFASLFLLCGYQAILFAIFAKTFAVSERLLPPDPKLSRFFELVNLETGLAVGAASMILDVAFLLVAIHQWWAVDFGLLEYAATMRWVIPG